MNAAVATTNKESQNSYFNYLFSYSTSVLSGAASAAINILSPKHTIRPDTFLETATGITGKVKSNLSFRLFQVSTLFKEHIPAQKYSDHLQLLTLLDKIDSSEINDQLNNDERQILNAFFNSPYDLNEFDLLVAKHPLKKKHDSIKTLLGALAPNFPFQIEKIRNLVEKAQNNELDEMQENEKFNVFDFSAFIDNFYANNLIEKLKDNGVEIDPTLLERWEELNILSKNQFFTDLKQACLDSQPPGTAFLVDRRNYEAINGVSFDWIATIEQIFMGNIMHIGVLVKPEGKGLHLSHVNQMTNSHATTPLRNPLSLPFFPCLSLDITSLLPSHLNDEKKQQLNDIFLQEFHDLAQEEHRELPLAQTWKHLIFGSHTSLFSTPLEKVDFPPSGTPIMCSTYVGIIFLKAIQKLNTHLDIEDNIPHPFGEYESLKNLDILRLLYLWKKLDVVKPSPVNEVVAKVINTSHGYF